MSGCLIKTIKLRIASPNNNSHVESHASIYKRVKEMKDKDTAINASKLARINYDYFCKGRKIDVIHELSRSRYKRES